MNKIYYLTYQTFPAKTANSIQTISMVKYLKKSGINVELVFPNRSPDSSDDLNTIKKHYDIQEDFNIRMLKHNLPFGKINILNKFFFHISHLLWSKYAVNKIISEGSESDIFLTRSDWIFYFLSRKKRNVTFECHQVSKIRNFVINSVKNNTYSKIVFTNEKLKDYFSVNNRCIVLNNAYDQDLFSDFINIKKESKIVFVGSLLRFEKDRNIKFLIESFKDPRLSNITLEIIGGPNNYKDELIEIVKKLKIENIRLLGQLSRKETIRNMLSAKVGILINSSDNSHSTLYTSPLKYFEYLASELNIIAVDFPSHRSLPESKDIDFFTQNDKESFINACLDSLNKAPRINEIRDKYNYEERVNKLLKFIKD